MGLILICYRFQVDMHGILRDIKINKVLQIRKAYDYAEKNAKKNQLGLWEEKKPIAPWKWRKIRK